MQEDTQSPWVGKEDSQSFHSQRIGPTETEKSHNSPRAKTQVVLDSNNKDPFLQTKNHLETQVKHISGLEGWLSG